MEEDEFAESIPIELVNASFKNYVVWFSLPITVLCILWGAIAGTIIPLLVFWPIGILIVLAVGTSSHFALKNQIPTVSLKKRKVLVCYGDQGINADIGECRLRYGRASSMRLTGRLPLGGVRIWTFTRVILVDFPVSAGSARYNTAAVGFTDEMQARWQHRMRHLLDEQRDETKSPSSI